MLIATSKASPKVSLISDLLVVCVSVGGGIKLLIKNLHKDGMFLKNHLDLTTILQLTFTSLLCMTVTE